MPYRADILNEETMGPQLDEMARELPVAYILWWNTCSFAVLCPICGRVEIHTPKRHQTTLEALCKGNHIPYIAAFHEMVVCEGRTIAYEVNRVKSRLEVVGLNVPEIDNLERIQGTRLEMGGLAIIDENFNERHQFVNIDQPLLEAHRREQTPIGQIGAVNNFLDLGPLAENGDQQGDIMQVLTKDLFNSLKIGSGRLAYPPKLISTKHNMKKIGGVINTGHYSPHLKPTISLGDLRLLQSQRPGATCIEILAPHGTKDGLPFTVPLAILKGRQPLRRTLAILCRKHPYPPVIAESGWTRFVSDSEFVIDNGKWGTEVERLAKYVRHTIAPHNLDYHSYPGKYNACHAEKQVIAYFVSKHCFFADGCEYADINKLQKVQPSQKLREAWISIDHKPCSDCKMFKKKVEAEFRIRLHFVHMNENFRRKMQKSRASGRSIPRSHAQRTLRDVRGSRPPRTSTRRPHPRNQQDEHGVENADNEEDSDGDDDYIDSDELGDPGSPSYGRNVHSNFRNGIHDAVRKRSSLAMNSSSIQLRRKQPAIPRIAMQEIDPEPPRQVRRTRSSAAEDLLGTPEMTEFGFDPILSPKKSHKRPRIEEGTESEELAHPRTPMQRARGLLAKKRRGLVTPAMELEDPFSSPPPSTPALRPVLTPRSLERGIDNLIHNTEKLNLRKRRRTSFVMGSSEDDEEADEMLVDRVTRSKGINHDDVVMMSDHDETPALNQVLTRNRAKNKIKNGNKTSDRYTRAINRGRNVPGDATRRHERVVIDLTADSDSLDDYDHDEDFVNEDDSSNDPDEDYIDDLDGNSNSHDDSGEDGDDEIDWEWLGGRN